MGGHFFIDEIHKTLTFESLFIVNLCIFLQKNLKPNDMTLKEFYSEINKLDLNIDPEKKMKITQMAHDLHIDSWKDGYDKGADNYKTKQDET